MSKLFALMLLLGGSFAVLLPQRLSAAEVELVSITPDAQNVSDLMPQPEDAPAGTAFFAFVPAPGTAEDEEYTAVFSADQEPAVVVTLGTEVESWSYDATAGTVTVTTIYRGGFFGPDGEQDPTFVISISFPVAPGEQGPPEEATGVWMSTNITDWQMIPPQPGDEKPQFGFILTGPAGTDGFFKMFLPQSLIDLMGEYMGEQLDIVDLAVFVDDEQASMAVEEVDGGALFNISITFTENTTQVEERETEGVDSVTKEVMAGEQLAVSLAAEKTKVKKGGSTNLFGWIKNGKKGETVTLWQKLAGETKYTKVTALKTKKNGYFVYEVTMSKTASFKVKYGSKSSSVKKVTVK